MSKDRLVLITNNPHKIAELTPVFREFNVPFKTTSYEKVEIRSDDVAEVARVAAQYAFEEFQCPVVVDDTGLYIDALNGFPKAYAAFVLRTIGITGILRLMQGIDGRTARFITAVGYADGDQLRTFTGVARGVIGYTPQGTRGFGYDPIFIPEGATQSYAQMGQSAKVAISHRTRAFRSFLEWFQKKRGIDNVDQ